jgi:hypothetical protein
MTNHHVAGFAACCPLGRMARSFGVVECGACFDQKRVPGLRQRNSAVRAQKELHA